MNIGVIEGGRAPNVIPDFAKAQILIRLVGPSDELKKNIEAAVGNLCEVAYVLELPFVKLRAFPGLPTFIAAFTTDIPYLSNWGEPVLFGPGSITVAHTDREFIAKKELLEAVETYVRMARELVA
jgi:acetylornithine deacetylase